MSEEITCPGCIESDKSGLVWKSRTMHESGGWIPCPRCGGSEKVEKDNLSDRERDKLKKDGFLQ